MNKKIKVIELLNKIANGEEMPKKIKYDNHIYEYKKIWEQYVLERDSLPLLKIISEYNYSALNEAVEILEDNTEEIEEYKGESFEQLGYEIGKMSTAIVRGLIKALNEMEKPIEKEHCCNCGVEITDENRALHNMCNECKYGIDWEEKNK